MYAHINDTGQVQQILVPPEADTVSLKELEHRLWTCHDWHELEKTWNRRLYDICSNIL